MNFFRTTFLLCTKISALTVLKDSPSWRAWLHTVLLLFLCPAFLATVQVRTEKREAEKILAAMEQETQGFRLSDGRLSLGSGAKEQHFSFPLLGQNTRLDYITEGIACDPDSWKENGGLILSPEALFAWSRPLSGQYTAMKIPMTLAEDYFRNRAVSLNDLWKNMLEPELYSAEQFIKKVDAGKPVETDRQAVTPTQTELLSLLSSLLWSMLFANTFNECFLLLLIGGITFSIVQNLRFKMLPNRLKYSKVLALTLYTMFPAMLIATLLTATGQKILMFQTIFFPVFFLYQLMAFSFLMRQMNPAQNTDSNNNDEEF